MSIKLDIGSGRAKMDGYITIDKDPSVGADICLDIEQKTISVLDFCRENFQKRKKELENNGEVEIGYNLLIADEIRAHHILEHFKPENKVKVMALFWDLLKDGGILDIEVPLFPHPASVQDPTHLSFWTKESFWYFIKGNKFGEAFAKRYSEYTVPLFEFVEDWEKGRSEFNDGQNIIINNPWAYGIKLKKLCK